MTCTRAMTDVSLSRDTVIITFGWLLPVFPEKLRNISIQNIYNFSFTVYSLHNDSTLHSALTVTVSSVNCKHKITRRMYVYVHIYIYIYIRTYVCIYLCMYVCMYARAYVCMYVCIYVCIYPIYVHMCVCVCTYVCMYTRVYVYMQVRVYLCVYIYIYTEGCKSRYAVLLCITLITVYLLLHPSVYMYVCMYVCMCARE